MPRLLIRPLMVPVQERHHLLPGHRLSPGIVAVADALDQARLLSAKVTA